MTVPELDTSHLLVTTSSSPVESSIINMALLPRGERDSEQEKGMELWDKRKGMWKTVRIGMSNLLSPIFPF